MLRSESPKSPIQSHADDNDDMSDMDVVSRVSLETTSNCNEYGDGIELPSELSQGEIDEMAEMRAELERFRREVKLSKLFFFEFQNQR